MTEMRIALVMLSDGPSHQRYAAYAARELAARHDVDVVTNPFVRRTLFQEGDFEHYPVEAPRTPKIEAATFDLPGLIRTARLLRSLSPDIIHYTCPHPWNMALPLLGPATKSVFTIHDVEPHPGESPSWATSIRIYNWVVSRLADRIVLHGEKHMTTVDGWNVPTDRFVVAPLGEFPAPPKPPPPSSSNAVLFFGRIRPYKGLALLAAAARELQNGGQKYNLVVAGSGDLGPYRDQLQEVGTEIHNRFIQPDEVPNFFGNCRIVVLPYESATQSGVIPQAFAYRRPVIATLVGAIPEMVDNRETGYLISPNDPKELAAAISHALNHPRQCDSMGERAYTEFLRRYTPRAMASRFETIYRTLRVSTGQPSTEPN